MKITDVKAALAEEAKSMNVQPIPAAHPVKASTTPKSTASAVKATKKETKEQSHKDVPAATKAPNKNADINSIIAANLQAGVDYAVIPGCGRKPALLKAGAEHLAAIFDYRSTCTILNRFADYQQKFVLYEVQTTIRDAAGNVIAEGIGSCNSRERKYLRTDFATNINTVLKMAKKRSYVDAILTACHASGVFTQDIEDISSSLAPSTSTCTAKEA